MTWTNIGSINPNNDPGPSSFSLTPSGVGDLIVMSVQQFANGTVTATALSSTNVTWLLVGSCLGTSLAFTETLFIGVVTAASNATVTVTWSGTVPTGQIIISGLEFHSSVGSWSVDTFTTLDSPGTATWPSMTAAASGELYVGAALNNGFAAAGSTSGFSYVVDNAGNGLAWSLNYTSGVSPVWGDADQGIGVMALIAETGGTPAVATPQPLVVPSRAAIQAASW